MFAFIELQMKVMNKNTFVIIKSIKLRIKDNGLKCIRYLNRSNSSISVSGLGFRFHILASC